MANRRFVPQRVRRPTFWEGAGLNLTVTTGASVSATVVSEAQLEQVPNPTLVRIRGSLLVLVTAAAATPSSCVAFLGIKVVQAAALAAGAPAVPFTDIGSDWVWWQAVGMNLAGGTVAAPNSDGSTIVHRVEIDSKAMRKIKGNEVLVFVAQNVVATSTQTFDVDGGMRVLLKR